MSKATLNELIDSLEAGVDIFEPVERGIRVESLKRPYK